MNVDVIMLSYAKDTKHFKLTNEALKSLFGSEDQDQYRFRVFVMETNKNFAKDGFKYNQPDVQLIIPKTDFNYNKFVNLGLMQSDADYVVVCNNDLEFKEGWFKQIHARMEDDPSLMSASPYEPTHHPARGVPINGRRMRYGYECGYEVCGWCVVMTRKLADILYPFDEKFVFWYQDKDYAMELKTRGVKHALVQDSKVVHKESMSHDVIPRDRYAEMTEKADLVFNQKWNNA